MSSKKSVATVESHPPVQHGEAVLSMVERVALDPNVDVMKLEKMLDLQERALDRQARDQFYADLADMQDKLPRVIEKSKAHNSKYAKLEDINDQIRPVLREFGFSVSFKINQSEGLITITTILTHRNGHSESTDLTLPADTSGSKNAVQAIGSTVSYGKRYGITSLLNISTGDDTDGDDLGRSETVQDNPELDAALEKILTANTDKSMLSAAKSAYNKFTDSHSRKMISAAKESWRDKGPADGSA